MTSRALPPGSPPALIAALWLVVAAYLGFVAWTHVEGHARAERGERPLFTDYTPTYAASMLVREMPAEHLYDPKRMTDAGRRAAHAMYDGISDEQARRVGFAPWMYPPTFILLIAPLAYLPYTLSWLAWLGVTALPYLAAMRQILPNRLAWPFALAAPPVFFNVMYGQTGFLSAGLIGLGLALLGRRPIAAGVLIGLASVKPHFGVLIPLAFIAGGHWRAFAAAALTVLATIVASVFAFGDDPWFAFIGTSLFHLEGFGAGAFNFVPMTTVLSTVQMAGLPLGAAWRAQYAAAALAAGVVVWAWARGRRRRDTLGLQAAILCVATPLALPMTYLYDLVLVVPGAAWLWADMRERGASRAEVVTLAAAMAALLPVKAVAATFGVQTGPLILAVLLALATHRHRRALARTVRAPT
ncbi:glycosyltransferase family 87 protein [Aromatoleum sp.]|uniref:glycosyltransferase family 87 protein n=1 Tax=Aromatoleum sp. TaxID=2307007 RepID=UPI002FC901D1